MATSQNTDSDKSFNVVFERQTPFASDEEIQPEYSVLESRDKTTVQQVTKQALRKRIEDLQSKHHDAKDHCSSKFTQLLDAVGQSTVHESQATDKLVHDIEGMMECFDKDMNKLQTTYKNILEHLPKIEYK